VKRVCSHRLAHAATSPGRVGVGKHDRGVRTEDAGA
jgi:hypothetical protein